MSEVVANEPRALLDALAEAGVRVSVEKGRIRLKGPHALLGDAFARLDAHRDAVIALLSSSDEPIDQTPALLEGGIGPAELAFLHLGDALVRAAEGDRGVVLFEAGSVQRVSYKALLQESLALLSQWQTQGVRAGDPVLLCLGELHAGLVCLWAAILGDLLAVPVSMGGGPGEAAGALNLWKTLDEMKRSVWWVADYASMKAAQFPIGRALASEVTDAGKPAGAWQPASQDSRRPALLLPSDDARGWTVLSHRDALFRATALGQRLAIETGNDSLLNATALHRSGSVLHGHLVAVCHGLEQVQVDEAMVAAEPLHWLRMLDDLAITITWAPVSLWQRVLAAIGASSDLQRSDVSLSLLRACLCDQGQGGAEAGLKALAEAMAAMDLDPAALVPAWGLVARPSCLLLNVADERRSFAAGLPIAGGSARVVSPEGELRVRGQRGVLQVRHTGSLRGDWLDAWRDEAWHDTGHVALIDDQGVVLLAWIGERQAVAATAEPALAAISPVQLEVDFGSAPVTAERESPVMIEVPATDAGDKVQVMPVEAATDLPVLPVETAVDAPVLAIGNAIEVPLLPVQDAIGDSTAVDAPVTDEAPAGPAVDILTGPAGEIAAGQSLFGRLQALARQRPRDVAVHQDTQFVRYQALVSQIDAWAASLRNAGTQAGDRVALVMPRGAEAIASLFALWRIGAVAVLLDTEEDDAFLRAVLTDANPRFVLCHDSVMHGAAGDRWRDLVDGICPRAGLKELPPASHLRDDGVQPQSALAAIFYSRDGDGVKGACFTHGDFLVQFHALSGLLAVRANARWIATSGFSGPAGLLESLMPLLAGATLLVTQGAIVTVERLVQPLRESGVTHVLLSPSMLEELLEMRVIPRNLTVVTTSMPAADVVARLSVMGVHVIGLDILDASALCAGAGVLTAPLLEAGAVCPPLMNAAHAVLGDDGQALMQPGVGEWLVRGAGIAAGFHGQVGRDAERYVTLQGWRYLRTGVRVSAEANSLGLDWVLRRV